MVVLNVMCHGESSAREARAKILVYIYIYIQLYIYTYIYIYGNIKNMGYETMTLVSYRFHTQ